MGDRHIGLFKGLHSLLVGFALLGLSSCSSTSLKGGSTPAALASERQRTSLDADWSFHLGDISPGDEVVTAAYDDRQWRRVDVPHDYVLEGTYVRSTEKVKKNHAYLPVDVAWYRKHFTIPASDQGKILRLDFDGAFRDSQVWLNGQRLGGHLSGYTPFSFDITRHANVGGDNVLVVRVDPRDFEGWWYEGAGIYRHVSLTTLSPVHVPQWGTYVTATVPNGDQGASERADVTIQTTVENSAATAADCRVVSEIVSPDGKVLETLETPAAALAAGRHEVTQQATVDQPKLWSIESPHLYQIRTTILQEGRPVDRTTTTFGIRTLRFDPDKGFFLNGKHVLIKGTACHQDFVGVGIAVPDSLQAWRVQQLKRMGCNAWRTAHNPPSEALLDACDRLGMLVMDENRHLSDTYGQHPPRGTIPNNLADLGIMIQRDRNHPSIIMWSMCNEEGAYQGNAEGSAIFSKMIEVVHRYDRTRPITSAMNAGWLNPTNNADLEDIVGVNYNPDKYDAIHQRHPAKMMYGSECMNEKTTRGEYVDDRAAGLRSGYNLSEEGWQAVSRRPWMAGAFTWTGFDYMGEPNPYGWPAISNNTGLMDRCGFPKDKYHYFQSCWSDTPMVHVMPDSWTWPGKEGQNIRVVTFSNAPQVELFLNGRSLGAHDVPRNGRAEWQVPYEPGRLLAKAYTEGKTVATDELQTTTAPARLQVTTDRTTLHANGEDAVVVAVALLDDQGRVVANADKRVTFHLAGGGRILGVGNGNPADHDPDKTDNRNTFHGRCIAVIQAGSRPAALQLTATSPGVASDRITFKVR